MTTTLAPTLQHQTLAGKMHAVMHHEVRSCVLYYATEIDLNTVDNRERQGSQPEGLGVTPPLSRGRTCRSLSVAFVEAVCPKRHPHRCWDRNDILPTSTLCIKGKRGKHKDEQPLTKGLRTITVSEVFGKNNGPGQ